jgi:hypothetical protein
MDIHQQVMGETTSASRGVHLLPKFKYNGGNPARFRRDFPLVAGYYGVADVYQWDVERDLTDEDSKRNTLAMAVLCQYLTEDVTQMLMVGVPSRALILYRALEVMFLGNDAHTQVQVQWEISSCEQLAGESLVSFLRRINGILNEQYLAGDAVSDEVRLVTVASRLREPWRTLANNRLEQEKSLTYEKLVSTCISVLRQSGEGSELGYEGAFVAREAGGSSDRERRGGVMGGRGSVLCWNCGQNGHVQRQCAEPVRCYGC